MKKPSKEEQLDIEFDIGEEKLLNPDAEELVDIIMMKISAELDPDIVSRWWHCEVTLFEAVSLQIQRDAANNDKQLTLH